MAPTKKKIIRIKRLKDGQPIEPEPTPGFKASRVTAGPITFNPLAANTIVTGTLTTSSSSPRVELTPSGIRFNHIAVPISAEQAITYNGDPLPGEKFSLEELDQKDEWTTAEAAWYCGITNMTTWHVYMGKEDGIAPITTGRGRGRQNMYLAKDVEEYKARLDAKRKRRK